MKLPELQYVIPGKDFTLFLYYKNQKKVFDVKPYLEKGIFQKLKNTEIFNSVSVEFDTVSWGDIDIAHETLYLDSEDIK